MSPHDTPMSTHIDAQGNETLAMPAAVDEDAVRDALEAIRPYVQADGGDLDLVRIEGHTVYIQVFGACTTCGALDMTMTHGVQSLLRDEVDPMIVVEQVL